MTQRTEDPEEYNVIIGHYKHAHDTKLIESRLTFVDEFAQDNAVDTFTMNGSEGTRIGKAMDGYFTYNDRLPWKSFNHFIAMLDEIDDPTSVAADIVKFHNHGGNGTNLVVSDRELMELEAQNRFHKKAPVIMFGLLMAEDLGNGWHSWTVPDTFKGRFDDLPKNGAIIRNDPENIDNLEIYLLEPIDLNDSSHVIGLDGTARKVMWDTIFRQDFEIEEFITCEQMPTYIEDVQGMELWQSSTKARPYAGGNEDYIFWEANASTALYARIKRGKPVVITPKKAASVLEREIEETFDKDVKPVEVRTSKGTEIENVMTFGKVPSNNEAAGTETICIFGCPQPSDEVFKKWGALMGIAVNRREGSKGMDLKFDPDPVGQEIYNHFVLDPMEQAIMRGRRGNGDESGSTVIVGTGKTPDWFTPKVSLDISSDSPFRSDTRRQLIRYLMEKEQATSSELKSVTGYSASGLYTALDPLVENGMVEKETQPGRASIYTWIGV